MSVGLLDHLYRQERDRLLPISTSAQQDVAEARRRTSHQDCVVESVREEFGSSATGG